MLEHNYDLNGRDLLIGLLKRSAYLGIGGFFGYLVLNVDVKSGLDKYYFKCSEIIEQVDKKEKFNFLEEIIEKNKKIFGESITELTN